MLKPEDRQKLDGIVIKMSENNESPADIQFVVDDFKKKYENQPITPQQVSQVGPKEKSFTEKIFSSENKTPMQNMNIGIGKGVLSTLDSMSQVGQDALQTVTNPIVEKITGQKATTENVALPSYTTEADGTAQSIGKGAEQIGEFFIPATLTAKLVRIGDVGIMGTKLATEFGKSGRMLAKSLSLATRSGLLAGEAAGVTSLQTYGDEDSEEQTKMNAMLAGAVPIVGKVFEKGVKPVMTALGNKIQTSVIKPSIKDIKDGFNIHNVGKYNVGGSLDQMASRTHNAIEQRSKQLQNIIQDSDAKFDLGKAIDEVEAELSKAGTKTFGFNSKLGKAIQTFREEAALVAEDGVVTIPEAQQIKRSIGKIGAWEFGKKDPDSSALEEVANRLYTKVKEGIESISPDSIRQINKELSELIPIENAVIRRIPVSERQNALSLSDVITVTSGLAHPGNWWLFVLNRMARSGTVGSVLEKGGRKLKEGGGTMKTLLFGPDKSSILPSERATGNKLSTAIDYMGSKGGLSIEDVSKKKVGDVKLFRAGTLDDSRGTGIFLSDNPKKAGSYKDTGAGGKEVVEYNLSNANLKEASNRWSLVKELDSTWDKEKIYDKFVKQGMIGNVTPEQRLQAEAEKRIKSILEKRNYDGVKYSGGQYTDQAGEYQIFNSKNIKAQGGVKTSITPAYKPSTTLTTKLLKDIDGKAFVSKQYMLDATNRPELKQVEKDLIRDLLETEGDKIDVPAFTQKVEAELLPLKVAKSKPRYEGVSLSDDLRGNVKNYKEHVYESPVNTSAGDVHFSDSKRKTALLSEEDKNALSGLKHSERFYLRRSQEAYSKKDTRSAEKFNGFLKETRSKIREIEEKMYEDLTPKGYFGHTRVEDMAPEYKVGNTTYKSKSEAKIFGDNPVEQPKVRRVIEVQSDLYQKDRLKNSVASAPGNYEPGMGTDLTPSIHKKIKTLEQYNNPTAHFRMVREEIKRAADDGVEKLQFPTGETGMKIEGLGQADGPLSFRLLHDDIETPAGMRPSGSSKLITDKLEVGQRIARSDGNFGGSFYAEQNQWIITDVLGDGKFKAVPKSYLEEIYTGDDVPNWLIESRKQGVETHTETFDISGKVDENNPIYKFYEKELGKYLKNKYKAELVTDRQGVTWMEVTIKPEHKGPVEAFGKARMDTILKGAIGTGALTAGVAGVNIAKSNSINGKTFENNKLNTIIADEKKTEPATTGGEDGISGTSETPIEESSRKEVIVIMWNSKSSYKIKPQYKKDLKEETLKSEVEADATVYHPKDEKQTRKGGDGKGASGKEIKHGHVAINKRSIPLGAKVYIKELDQVFVNEDRMNGGWDEPGYYRIDFAAEPGSKEEKIIKENPKLHFKIVD